jgi:hypothetical protein
MERKASIEHGAWRAERVGVYESVRKCTFLKHTAFWGRLPNFLSIDFPCQSSMLPLSLFALCCFSLLHAPCSMLLLPAPCRLPAVRYSMPLAPCSMPPLSLFALCSLYALCSMLHAVFIALCSMLHAAAFSFNVRCSTFNVKTPSFPNLEP